MDESHYESYRDTQFDWSTPTRQRVKRTPNKGNNDPVNTETKILHIPRFENNVKHVHNESVDVRNKQKNEPANVDCKREKNLKVHSFLRNLGIRIMKVFQVKDS